MKKRKFLPCLGCLLSLILALALLPGAAVAADETPVTVTGADGTVRGSYATMAEAMDVIQDGDTITLTDNLVLTRDDQMIVTNTITLDGQGYTMTADDTAFSMIEVETTGHLTLKNITLDGNGCSNRSFSSILQIEGGYAVIEEGTVLTNNATAAVDLGVNVPGGTCVMNGGIICNNVMPAGSNDTGVAVTVLEESTFIMNGGTISGNQTLKYGSSGIMVNRGGTAILNGGVIENNATQVAGMASAVHIQGGYVELNGTTIRNNTSAAGYGAVYVTNHSSFGRYWDGVLDINGGAITGNKDANGDPNAIYLLSWSGVFGTHAYVNFSGTPDIQGPSTIYANSSSQVDFAPLNVDGAFDPVTPVELDPLFYYIVDQTIVLYADGLTPDSSHFVASQEDYGFQADLTNQLLYTEQRRPVVYLDGDQELSELSCRAFVEDTLDQSEDTDNLKPGYVLEGWYQDQALTQPWDFDADTLPREDGTFYLYAKWSPVPAQAPELDQVTELLLTCDQEDSMVLTPDFQEEDGYAYTYLWTDAQGATLSQEKTLSVPSPANGEQDSYTLTVTATRQDNGQQAQASGRFVVTRSDHDMGNSWENHETSHWHSCSVCGLVADEEEHSFVWVTDQEATETQPGTRHEECSVCGYQMAAVEIPATGTTQPGDSEGQNPDSSVPGGTDKPGTGTTDTGASGSGTSATSKPTNTQSTAGSTSGNQSSPKTGDTSAWVLGTGLLLAGTCGLTVTVLYKRKTH